MSYQFMSYQVTIKTLDKDTLTPSYLVIREGDSLLAASERCFNKTIAVGCRQGGCGVCRVRVISGEYESDIMSRAHISEDDIKAGVVLACRIYPKSDMEITHEEFIPVKSDLTRYQK